MFAERTEKRNRVVLVAAIGKFLGDGIWDSSVHFNSKETAMFRVLRLAFTSANLLLIAPYAVAAPYNFINIADTARSRASASGHRP